MRADARGGGPVPVPSEGRIRAAGQVFLAAALGNCSLFFLLQSGISTGNRGSGGGSVPMPSEARMRAAGQVVQAVLYLLYSVL